MLGSIDRIRTIHSLWSEVDGSMVGRMPYLLHIQWRLDLGNIVLDVPFKVPEVDGLTYRSCHCECAASMLSRAEQDY